MLCLNPDELVLQAGWSDSELSMLFSWCDIVLMGYLLKGPREECWAQGTGGGVYDALMCILWYLWIPEDHQQKYWL
jgi:hypothetical protein